VPQIAVASTGVPQASASSTTFGQPSRSDGSTSASAARYHGGSSAGFTAPTKRTRSPSPSAATRARSRPSASPLPTKTSSGAGPAEPAPKTRA